MARRGSRVGVHHVAQHGGARVAGCSAHFHSGKALGYFHKSATDMHVIHRASACKSSACRDFIEHACGCMCVCVWLLWRVRARPIVFGVFP